MTVALRKAKESELTLNEVVAEYPDTARLVISQNRCAAPRHSLHRNSKDDVLQTFELAKSLDLDRWSWSIYSSLPGSSLYEELIAEGKIEPYRPEHHQVHFTEAYEGICDIEPDRLKALYHEINEYFCHKGKLPLEIAG